MDKRVNEELIAPNVFSNIVGNVQLVPGKIGRAAKFPGQLLYIINKKLD